MRSARTPQPPTAGRIHAPTALGTAKPGAANGDHACPDDVVRVLCRAGLMTTSALQTLLDGRNIVDSNFIYQRDQLGFSEIENANYLTFAGVKICLGGLLGKPLMTRFGQ